MKVRIPTPLRSYTNDQTEVDATGRTIADVLEDLDRQFPGLRFRVVDEQRRLRPHMKIFVGVDPVRDLTTDVTGAPEITLMQALSGG